MIRHKQEILSVRSVFALANLFVASDIRHDDGDGASCRREEQ